jgi:hypothetical protein
MNRLFFFENTFLFFNHHSTLYTFSENANQLEFLFNFRTSRFSLVLILIYVLIIRGIVFIHIIIHLTKYLLLYRSIFNCTYCLCMELVTYKTFFFLYVILYFVLSNILNHACSRSVSWIWKYTNVSRAMYRIVSIHSLLSLIEPLCYDYF